MALSGSHAGFTGVEEAMALTAGTKLGTFEIVELIGVGGMGEVYRARDTRLGREVAIKVLPPKVAQDPDRLARFEREAKLLASLTHAHIATLYDFQSEGDVHFLVMELVEGATLADRISAGPLPLDEVILIFRQIADALETAHESGIVHRDLKPANVKITPDDKVKVLDFGVAKATSTEPPSGLTPYTPTPSPDTPRSTPDATTLAATPTPPSSLTSDDMLIGTPSYMSPEQARGKKVDRRADIWAFGCCLYEALTGQKVFEGDTVAEKISSVTRDEPDWEALPSELPENIRGLLERCLRKDPSRRLRDIGDARIELEETESSPTRPASMESERRPSHPIARWQGITLGLAGVVVAVLLSTVLLRDTGVAPGPEPASEFMLDPEPPPVEAPKRVRRIAMTLPPDAPLADSLFGDISVALSPDGQRLAYVADIDGTRMIVTRRMDRFDSNVLEGTDGALSPFFSPDGQWIAFNADRKMKKVRVGGGAPVVLTDMTFTVPGFWDDDGYIYYTPNLRQPIQRIAASGGTPEVVIDIPESAAGNTYFVPQMLPGNRALVYSRSPGPDINLAEIIIRRFEDGEDEVLATAAARPIYAPSGHIVYVQEGRLSALPFDLDTLEITGPAAEVTEAYMSDLDSMPFDFSLSDEGTLVYVPGGTDTSLNFSRTLVWVDQDGNESPINAPPRPYYGPRLSRDGERVVVDIRLGPSEIDVWVLDLNRGTLTRVTTHESSDMLPAWHVDDRHVVFSSSRAGDGILRLYQTRADGTSEPNALTSGDLSQFTPAFTPDATAMLFSQLSPDQGFDVYILPLDGTSEPRPLIATQFAEGNAGISPDGKWVAYASQQSGRGEVYVQAFPELGQRLQISVDGGSAPVWAADGSALYFQSPTAMLRVEVKTSPTFEAGIPEVLFEDSYYRDPALSRTYDVSPIDGRFIMLKALSEEDRVKRTELMLVENWFEELKRLAPRAETP